MDRKAIKKTIDIHKKNNTHKQNIELHPKSFVSNSLGSFHFVYGCYFFYDITNLDTSAAIGLSASHQLISLKSKSFFH